MQMPSTSVNLDISEHQFEKAKESHVLYTTRPGTCTPILLLLPLLFSFSENAVKRVAVGEWLP